MLGYKTVACVFKLGACRPRPVHAWFLIIALSVNVYMHMLVCLCVCPPLRLLLTNGVMGCDIDTYDWLNKF